MRLTYQRGIAALQRKADAIQREVLASEQQAVNETRQMFLRASSGTLTTKQLRMMGHPYARRDPQTPLNPAVINGQTGDFRRDWKASPPRMMAGVVKSNVRNVDPKAKYMLGTRRMVARTIDQAVAAKIGPRRLILLRGALRRGLKA